MIGAIGYELFAGRRPSVPRTLEQLVTAAFSDEIADPRVYASSLPVDAALCLIRCLARRPANGSLMMSSSRRRGRESSTNACFGREQA
jgi:hypothetical protein